MTDEAAISRLVHDARAPLNSITMNAELMKILLNETGNIARATEIIDVIIDQCKACDEVLETFRNQQKGQE